MSKKKKDDTTSLATQVMADYKDSYDALDTIRETWEEKEALIVSDTQDSISSSVSKGSRVHTPELQNAVIRRTNTTMSQLPTGKVQALSTKDVGKNMMMNLALTKYVVPNANSQRPLYTKSWMVEFYSLVFGSQPILVDYVVEDRYVGPDFYVLPIRSFVPQKGRYSLTDCEHVFTRSEVNKSFLEGKKGKDGWKNIDYVLEHAKGMTKKSEDKSYIEGKEMKHTESDQIELITRYERDRWVIVNTNTQKVVRDVENKFEDGDFPIVMKDAFPLVDRFHGLGEFERGKSLQYSLNSLVNLYHEGVKMSIFPPQLIYYPDVIARTIVNEAGAKYVLRNMNPNAVTELKRSPAGINTFQSTYQFLKGAILNLTNTTDTSVGKSDDIQQGKTPAAIKFNAAMDATRSNFDRKQLELSLEQVYDKFVNLLATKQEKPIKLDLFEEDLKLIQQTNPDVVEMFESGKYGKVTIKPSDINKTKYKFFIDSGSTLKADEAIEHETLKEIWEQIMSLPDAERQVAETGKIIMGNKSIDVPVLLQRLIITSGIQDWEKIISELTPEEMQQIEQEKQAMAQQAMQQQQQMQQMPQQGIPQGMPQGQPMMNPDMMPPQGGQPVNFEQPPYNELVQGMGQQPTMTAEDLMAELQGV